MQKFNQGPGVYRQETDISDVASPASTSIGALAGKTIKGRANERITVSTDKEWVDQFGNPNNITLGMAGYAAVEFLKESNQLVFVRSTDGTETYANLVAASSGTSLSVGITAQSSTSLVGKSGYADGNKPTDIYDLENASIASVTGSQFLIGAVGPGTDGNNIGIAIITSASSVDAGTSAQYDWANAYDNSGKIFKLNVYRKNTDDTFAAVSASSPVETFYVSLHSLKDASGKSLYITDVINGNSQYIYIKGPATPATSTFTLPGKTTTIVTMVNGVDATGSMTDGIISSAYSIMGTREWVTVNIIISPYDVNTYSSTVNGIAQIAGTRMDCMGTYQVGTSDNKTVGTIKAAATSYTAYPSYMAPYVGYSLYYDKYNDRNIFIPNSIYGASLMAKTDRVANTWDAPAGLNRGVLPVLGQNVILNGTDIGTLYDANLNCVKKIPGAGFVMWGQKTAQLKKSALDRINVRRLLIYLENSIDPSLQGFLFESNTDKTRSRVFNVVDSFMKTVEAGHGVTAYSVVCDDTNNTAQVIDNNQLNVDLYIQPTKVSEYIKLQTIITRTGVNFTEVQV
jgi:hypothetical protein